jgi:hypothetical protein
MSVESGYIKGGPNRPAPAPTEVCKYSNGVTCTCGTPHCNRGTLE